MIQRFSTLSTTHKVFFAILLGGVGWFCTQVAELIRDHAAEGFAYFQKPLGIADVVSLVGSSLTMVAGALGLPFDRLTLLLKGNEPKSGDSTSAALITKKE